MSHASYDDALDFYKIGDRGNAFDETLSSLFRSLASKLQYFFVLDAHAFYLHRYSDLSHLSFFVLGLCQ